MESTFKVCRLCGIEKPLTEAYWHPHKLTRDKFYHECRDCRKLQAKAWSLAIRLSVFGYYSGGNIQCACPGGCKESRLEFMCIDHIDGGGKQHRQEIGSKGGRHFYRWLIKNNFPSGYRVLCHNCNMSRAAFGYCPHENE